MVKNISSLEKLNIFVNNTTFPRAILFINKMKSYYLFQSLIDSVKYSITDICYKYDIENFPSILLINNNSTESIVYNSSNIILYNYINIT